MCDEASGTSVRVFFNGLFMDERRLTEAAVRAAAPSRAHLDGYRLRIGERATLVPEPGARAHGLLWTVPRADLDALYAEPSVAGYAPVEITATLADGTSEPALCYLLSKDLLTGTNPSYAQSRLQLAQSLDLPASYLDQIREERDRPSRP